MNSWRFAATFLPVVDVLEGTWTGVDVEVDEETDEFDDWDGLRRGRDGNCA